MQADAAGGGWDTHRQVRRKRRTLLWYIGLVLIGLALLGLTGVTALFLYWRSLIHTYTVTTPVPLAEVRGSDLERSALLMRWALFYETVRQGLPADPIEFTADELNLLIAGNPEMEERLRVELTNGNLYARFHLSLGESGRKELQGRYLHGKARLQVDLSDGWLTVTVAEAEANGRPIPNWMLRRIQQENLARDLDRNAEVQEFLRQLAAIEVSGDRLILRPIAAEP